MTTNLRSARSLTADDEGQLLSWPEGSAVLLEVLDPSRANLVEVRVRDSRTSSEKTLRLFPDTMITVVSPDDSLDVDDLL